ncbi:Mitochondrial tRNA-specific 2-thiouridylase 1 [Hondaea fermentalgiana]|uniref:tRNA-5-taurinomethyluridine 2-sulfurtransferase n=1 Tax=Hondaea fermentalgiana TaxID=2315210 RepID=A0A2R5GA03_9STRA|nr:Mitochondrial tRNA-specific 2-thiouridylase 1 [Hondaea fermentalgiana]|eukprot:GBG24514.1 Mitochondrial tRNA-specific 2-thiouridylase 1 [Hondaea fermentalgiana]
MLARIAQRARARPLHFASRHASSAPRGGGDSELASTAAKRRVVVGISGGVDSSVAALLLKQSGQFDEVVGVFMQNWDPGDEAGDSYTCPIAEDYKYAREVCEQLDIELHAVNFVQEYWNEVFEPYLTGFRRGTPNPDIFCNREIKFKCFRKHVEERFGKDTHLATGHYASLRRDEADPNALPLLVKAVDPIKDQTYFLCGVPGEALRRVHFPLGHLHKTRVREIAAEAGLCTASKKDSVGICFVGKRKFGDFIEEYIEPVGGDFVNEDGVHLGTHSNVHAFTHGQRAPISGAASKMYVARKDIATGRILVVDNPRHPLLLAQALRIHRSALYWVNGEAPGPLGENPGKSTLSCMCKVRYRTQDVPVTLRFTDASCEWLEVRFENAAGSATSQQVAAFYLGDVCLGGGVIHEVQSLAGEDADCTSTTPEMAASTRL